jgi:hypothetical protein
VKSINLSKKSFVLRLYRLANKSVKNAYSLNPKDACQMCRCFYKFACKATYYLGLVNAAVTITVIISVALSDFHRAASLLGLTAAVMAMLGVLILISYGALKTLHAIFTLIFRKFLSFRSSSEN